jgi:predicted nucleic acid-binding protein
MNVLVDTNIVSRMAQPGSPQYRAALGGSDALRLRGDLLYVVPQVLYEFWAVATRPLAVNGLGLTVAAVAAELTRLKVIFPLLPDNAAIFREWERLVTTYSVSGKNAHDARLVAAMAVHGLTHILTFNTADFARYPGITALDPLAVAPAARPTP